MTSHRTKPGKLATVSLAHRAYLEIRNKILNGDLPVGMALSRRKLAMGLNISVPPVSEALQRLEREELLESKPRVGTRVRVPTRRDIEDRSLVREALETQAARLFAEHATTAEKKELRRMGRRVDQLYAACETSSDREFLFSVNTYHMKLHLRIAECARCSIQRRSLGSDFRCAGRRDARRAGRFRANLCAGKPSRSL
jgi:GntR family transcriptional regulator, rspAB operon transcriptional repressor